MDRPAEAKLPLIRLRAQDHRVFFRDKGDYLEISRVLDRNEAYLMGYEAKKTEHCGPKRGNGAYWGYKWEAKKESNRIRRENAKREIRDATIDVIEDGPIAS